MTKEIITNYLDKFNYDFTLKNEKIFVNLDWSLQVIIDLSVQEKVIVKDKLKSTSIFIWPLSSMGLKGAIRSNLVSSVLLLFLFSLASGIADSYHHSLLLLSFLIILWVPLVSLYYLIKSENFKREIKDLVK